MSIFGLVAATAAPRNLAGLNPTKALPNMFKKSSKQKKNSDLYSNIMDKENIISIRDAVHSLKVFPGVICKEIAEYAVGDVVWCSYSKCEDPCLIYLHSDTIYDFYADTYNQVYYCKDCIVDETDPNKVIFNCVDCDEICIKTKDEMKSNRVCACSSSHYVCDRENHYVCDICNKPACGDGQCYIAMCGDINCRCRLCARCGNICEYCGWYRCSKCGENMRSYSHFDNIMSVCNVAGMFLYGYVL